MLSKLIVASYAWLLEIYLWLALAAAGVAGYETTVPLMMSAGVIPEHELAWKIVGALAFAVIAFLFLAVIAGPLFVLMDLRHAVRSIEAKTRGEVIGSLPSERQEPKLLST